MHLGPFRGRDLLSNKPATTPVHLVKARPLSGEIRLANFNLMLGLGVLLAAAAETRPACAFQPSSPVEVHHILDTPLIQVPDLRHHRVR